MVFVLVIYFPVQYGDNSESDIAYKSNINF